MPKSVEELMARANRRYTAAKAAAPGYGKFAYSPSPRQLAVAKEISGFLAQNEMKILYGTENPNIHMKYVQKYHEYYSVLFHVMAHRLTCHNETTINEAVTLTRKRFEGLRHRSLNNPALKEALSKILYEVDYFKNLPKETPQTTGLGSWNRSLNSVFGPGEVYSAGLAFAINLPKGSRPRRYGDDLDHF